MPTTTWPRQLDSGAFYGLALDDLLNFVCELGLNNRCIVGFCLRVLMPC